MHKWNDDSGMGDDMVDATIKTKNEKSAISTQKKNYKSTSNLLQASHRIFTSTQFSGDPVFEYEHK